MILLWTSSMYKEVMAAYENDIDKSFTDKATITVGSVYGGIIFSFKNDKVEKENERQRVTSL